MKKKLIILSILLFFISASLTVNASPYKSLEWKGQTWDVRTEYGQPGPNYFSASGPYIDSKNRMHLTVVKKNGKWYCSEIVSRNKFLYGKFTFKTDSPVFTFDRNSVCGMFTYLNDQEELDIEFTKWGASGSKSYSPNNIWYSVQPYANEGNNAGFLTKENGKGTVSVIDWQPTYVRFTTKTASGKIISDFNYTNVAGIPKNPEYLIFNVWLQGKPANGRSIDFIVSDFSYQK